MKLTDAINQVISEQVQIINEFSAAYFCQHPSHVGRCELELHVQEVSAFSEFFDPCSVYSAAPSETRLVVSIEWNELNAFNKAQLRGQSKEIAAQFWERWKFNSAVDLSMVWIVFSAGKAWIEVKPCE